MGYITGLKKGVNLGGWLSQCNNKDEHYASFISEEDIRRVSSWGADHVRLPIDYEAIETDAGLDRQQGYHAIDACIAWCKKFGLRMVLDLHKTAGYTFTKAYGSVNNLFVSEALQDRFVALWRKLAARYGNDPDTVVFELLNEVVEEENSAPWNRLILRTIEAVRRLAPVTPVIVGGIEWNSVAAVRLLDTPYDNNVIYTFHFYEPFAFTHQKARWVPETANIEIEYPAPMEEYRQAAKVIGKKAEFIFRAKAGEMGISLLEELMLEAVSVASERGVALYCGEYGVIDQAPVDSTLKWFQDMHELFEKYEIGRAAWSYKEMDFGLADKHYEKVLEGIVGAL